jgi:hypothetical protein
MGSRSERINMSQTAAREGDFLLEVTRFTPKAVTETYSIEMPGDLDAAWSGCEGEETLVLALACDDGAAGAFFLFLAEGRACIHLTEGVCWTACQQASQEGTKAVSFRMDNGETLEVIAEQTVTRQLGWTALQHWYLEGERWDVLRWRKL